MLTELGGKGGNVCREAEEGKLRCPLIVRPNSEDVITGEIFGVLGAINPRWWLSDLVNRGVGCERLRRKLFRQVRIDLWQRQPSFPADLAPWKEGRTEVDVVITFENPPTTIFVEMKYRSTLSPTTTHQFGLNGYPSDQLLRNARVGLWRCGWYDEPRLFEAKRDFILLLCAPERGEPLVDKYRDTEQLLRGIPHSNLIGSLPRTPFIGQLGYADIAGVLQGNRTWLNRAERILADRLERYLQHKIARS